MNLWRFFAFLYAPFLINDLFFMHAFRFELWLFFDYFFKILALSIALYFVFIKKISFEDLGFKTIAIKPMLAWSVVLSVSGILIDQYLFELISSNLPSWKLFAFPAIDSDLVLKFDLVFGLALTAVSEEVVFRGVVLILLARFFASSTKLVIFSCVVFGLAHWGLGVALIINAMIWGILPAISVLKTRSIYPAIVAHYLTNLVDFAGFLH